MTTLSTTEIERYQRHLTLAGFGELAQLKLKSARVLVVGAGGLGCPALQYLAAVGVGTLGIVDDDRVCRSNLQRQILYTESDVGQLKAEVAAVRLLAMNSDVCCEVHATRLTVANALELIDSYDLVLDGSDNFTTRYLVNDACVLAAKPLVYGALQSFQGQASVFNYCGGPTYRCLFPQPPRPEDAPNCSEVGVLGVLPGIIGVIQATEAIKVLTGIGEPLSGQLLIYDALKMSQTRLRFERVPELADVTELTDLQYHCSLPEEHLPEEMAVDALRALLAINSSAVQVIDVRERWERALFKIDSVHLPLRTILEQQADIAEFALQLDRPTVVYCKAGSRSLKALRVLQSEYGFTRVYSLKGGMQAWSAAL